MKALDTPTFKLHNSFLNIFIFESIKMTFEMISKLYGELPVSERIFLSYLDHSPVPLHNNKLHIW